MDTVQVDLGWFVDRFKAKKTSATKVAALVGMPDKSAMSNFLYGKRLLKSSEAAALAEFLGEPLDEVLRRAGVDAPVPRGQGVNVVGWCDIHGDVHRGRSNGPAVVKGPTKGEGQSLRAVRAQGGGLNDGWLYFYQPVERGVSGDAIGRLCVVEKADGSHGLRWVKRGYEPRKWNLGHWSGTGQWETADLVSAAPVLWIGM